MEEVDNLREKAVLVGTFSPKNKYKMPAGEPDVEDSLEELRQLAITSEAEVVEVFACRLDRINPRTYINKGKIEEIADFVKMTHCQLVIFDEELTGSQNKNLEKDFCCKVVDRRALILDIFAKRARTSEGKLQVELAQLIYMMPRLTRLWTHLERQKGGIGLRGPGEKQLELDKRMIRDRMRRIKMDLKKVQNSRRIQREKRQKIPVPQVVLVGYTNSGKSTLFNMMTDGDVLAADKLFATLDPTTRKLQLSQHREVLLTDSVGFIRKLPTELIEAFKATLEEVQQGNLLLHVIDCSDPLWESHKRATENVLADLDCLEKPILEVYNKIDLVAQSGFGIAQSSRRVFISALSGQNLDVLKEKIADLLDVAHRKVKLMFPQGRGDLLALVHREGNIIEEKYEAEFVEMTVELPNERVEQWKKEGFVIVDYSPILL